MDRRIQLFPSRIKHGVIHQKRRRKNVIKQSRKPMKVIEKHEEEDISELESFIDKMSVTEDTTAISLYEEMTVDLKAEVSFLTKLNQATLMQDVSMNQKSNSALRDEIMHLRRELQTKNNFIKLLVSPDSSDTCLDETKNEIKHASSKINFALLLNNREFISSAKVIEDKIEVVGDFMLNNIQVRELSKLNNVRISYFSGYKTPDLLSFINRSICRTPNKIIIHVGTNDMIYNGKMVQTIDEIFKYVRRQSQSIQITFSSVIIRKDKEGIQEKIRCINMQIFKYCQEEDIGFIDNSNITSSCLDISNVHLNRKGNSLFAENILHHITQH